MAERLRNSEGAFPAWHVRKMEKGTGEQFEGAEEPA